MVTLGRSLLVAGLLLAMPSVLALLPAEQELAATKDLQPIPFSTEVARFNASGEFQSTGNASSNRVDTQRYGPIQVGMEGPREGARIILRASLDSHRAPDFVLRMTEGTIAIHDSMYGPIRNLDKLDAPGGRIPTGRLGLPVREAGEPMEVRNLTLTSAGIAPGNLPRMLASSPAASRENVRFQSDEKCAVEEYYSPSGHEFGEFVLAQDHNVVVECRLDGLDVSAFQTYELFGLDVVLSYERLEKDGSTTYRTEKVRTGTYPGSIGHRNASRSLEITSPAPLGVHASLSSSAQVRVAAPEWDLVGTLDDPRPSASPMSSQAVAHQNSTDRVPESGTFHTMATAPNTLRLSWTTAPDIARTPIGVAASIGVGAVLVIVGFFTRLRENRLLEQRRRREIHQVVAAEPGIQVSEIARVLGIHWGTANYHLTMMAAQGLVQLQKIGRATAVFPQGSALPTEQSVRRLARKPILRALLRLLQARPESRQDELARSLDIGQAHVSRLLRRAADAGLLRRKRHGRGTHYDLTDLARLMGSNEDDDAHPHAG